MSLTTRLRSWYAHQERVVIARQNGYDVATAELVADLIAARIRASAPQCPYPVHAPDCGPCAAARQAGRDARIALETGELR